MSILRYLCHLYTLMSKQEQSLCLWAMHSHMGAMGLPLQLVFMYRGAEPHYRMHSIFQGMTAYCYNHAKCPLACSFVLCVIQL